MLAGCAALSPTPQSDALANSPAATAGLPDRAELDARARGAIDAMPPTREHPEPEARIGRKRTHSIG